MFFGLAAKPQYPYFIGSAQHESSDPLNILRHGLNCVAFKWIFSRMLNWRDFGKSTSRLGTLSWRRHRVPAYSRPFA
jgi:hypothetical protein